MRRVLRIGFQIPFQPGAQSGGNLFDRRLAAALGELGHDVCLVETGSEARTRDADVLIEDELLHPILKAGAGIPRVAMVHHLGCDEPERGARERAALAASEQAFLRGVQGILAPSSWSRDRALALAGTSVPAAVTPPGRDALGGRSLPDGLPGEAEVERRAGESGPLRVVFLGRLSRRKRIRELVEAVRLVPGCDLTVCGEPDPDEPELARRVRESGVRTRHHLDADGLAAVLRSAQVLAGPSTHEGFGLIYLEAFAFGLPVIAAASGGAPDLVSHGKNGWLVQPTDGVTRIAEILRRAAGNRDALGTMGRAALRTHRDWPTWAETGRVAEQLIRRAMMLA